jgi:oligo-1,6-glucosidase
MARPDSVFHYYQKLIRLRKEQEIIVYGSYELLLPEDENLFAYTRTLEGEKLLVVCNFSEKEQTFAVPEPFRKKNGCLLIQNDEERCAKDFSGETMIIRPYEAFAWKIQKESK